MGATAVLDGRRVAAELEEELAAAVAALGPPPPVLAVVLASDDPLAHRQVGLKQDAAERVGVSLRFVALPASAGQREVEAAVADLAGDEGVDGLFVQHPLPPGLDASRILALVPPAKDVDALAPGSGRAPATPAAVVRLLERSGVALVGTPVAVVGDEAVAAALRAAGALAWSCDRPAALAAGPTVVVALDEPVGPEELAPGVVLVPQRGGAGPVTVAVLLERTLDATRRRRGTRRRGTTRRRR